MLDYLLSSINKPGRAVRALLGGRPEDLGSFLPFSDSLGLTSPEREVTSEDLYRQLGGSPDDDLSGLGSLGVAVGTDPLTYAGGTIARALLGRAARAGMSAEELAHGRAVRGRDVFDLVSPAERGADPAAGLVEQALPAAAPQRPRLLADLHPDEIDHPFPANDLLREVPHADNYAHLTGHEPGPLGVYSPGTYGVAADQLAETGDRIGAFRTSLGAWDEALADLERMHPNLRRLMGEGMVGPDWHQPIASRVNDLRGAADLIREGAAPAGLMDDVTNQILRLKQFARSRTFGQSDALQAVRDVIQGHVRPSVIPGWAAEHMGHLPYDERALRALAARQHRQTLEEGVLGQIFDAAQEGVLGAEAGVAGAEVEPTVANLSAAMAGAPDYLVDSVGRRLEQALDPARYSSFEPGIVGDFFRNPGGVYEPDIREAQRLLEELRGAHPELSAFAGGRPPPTPWQQEVGGILDDLNGGADDLIQLEHPGAVPPEMVLDLTAEANHPAVQGAADQLHQLQGGGNYPLGFQIDELMADPRGREGAEHLLDRLNGILANPEHPPNVAAYLDNNVDYMDPHGPALLEAITVRNELLNLLAGGHWPANPPPLPPLRPL